MKKYGLHFMTWKEIENIFKEKKIILIPMGSMEQHGEHSINGDYLAATKVAEKVAEKTNNIYIPTIPFGNSSYFKSYPGTISLSDETVTSLIKDILNNLIEHNQYKIVFLNGHAGNKSAINNSVRNLKSQNAELKVYTFNLWQTLTSEQKNQIYDSTVDPSGHGAEPLSSIMRYLYPDLVDNSISKFSSNKFEGDEYSINNLNQINIDGVNVDAYFDMDELSHSGVYSKEFEPSGTKGEALLDAVVGNIVKSLNKLF